MKTTIMGVLAMAGLAAAANAAAQVTFYEGEGFRGRSFVTDRQIGNLERFGFNDRASSMIIERGRWEVCEDARFSGNCTVLRRGQYPSLREMGLNNRVSSIRPVTRNARYPEQPPPPVAQPYEYYPRQNEQLYTADVVAVRAVVGPPQQRCWVEREQVVRGDPGGPNVPGAIIGGVLGGVLGHQIGSGRGNDVATALGAIGGAAIGANTGQGGGGQVYTQDVQRCADVEGPMRPEYWDVTYVFRGREHRVQMSAPPGRTITVNRNGEPRM